jgi:pimeloyl-ACP methyl ester carboxylesterase
MDLQEFNAHRKRVSTGRGEIAYVEVGEGPVALFVHGVFLNGYLWRHVLDALSTDRRCIALDLPVHGQTRVPADADLSLPAQAEVLEAFCEALDIGEVDLVANDTGGAVAQVFAARHPQRLRTLTLTNCDSHDNLPPPNFSGVVELASQGQLAPIATQMVDDLDMARSEMGLGAGYEDPAGLSAETVRTYLEPVAGTPEAARQLERFITSLSAADLLAAEPALRELRAPTLIVWGTGDTFFEREWAYRLRDTIPGTTEVVEVPGAKLFFPDERPADLVEPLRRHWAAHPARAAAHGG